MLWMGPVHARDNGSGVSGAEPERTARYWDLWTPEQEYSIADPLEIGLGRVHTRHENQE